MALDSQPATVACAVLHTDSEGNPTPCPGYPHPGQPKADENGLYDCPHCSDAVVDLDEHLKACTVLAETQIAEARRLLAAHEQQQTQACLNEIEQVLARYGRKLQISQPQISIVPQ